MNSSVINVPRKACNWCKEVWHHFRNVSHRKVARRALLVHISYYAFSTATELHNPMYALLCAACMVALVAEFFAKED